MTAGNFAKFGRELASKGKAFSPQLRLQGAYLNVWRPEFCEIWPRIGLQRESFQSTLRLQGASEDDGRNFAMWDNVCHEKKACSFVSGFVRLSFIQLDAFQCSKAVTSTYAIKPDKTVENKSAALVLLRFIAVQCEHIRYVQTQIYSSCLFWWFLQLLLIFNV